MTELKTKHKGEPALRFFRDENLYARIDAATDSGEINRILVSAKHLVELIHPNENNTYWKKELQVAPSDLSCLHTLLVATDEDRLDEAGAKALKALSKAVIQQTLPLIEHRYFNGMPSPEIPASSIYSGKNATDLTQGEPAEFGVYNKGQPYSSVVTEFFHQNKDLRLAGKTNPVCETPITKHDLVGLDFDAISGNYQLFTAKAVKLIMDSPKAFSEVSKSEFASAYLKAAEQPRALGMFAIVALSNLYANTTKGATGVEHFAAQETVGKLAGKAWNLSDSYRGNYLFSAKEFTVNEFAAKPFTVEEIKALPFLLGQHKDVYAEVKHDHAIHAQACAEKLRSAGYEVAADAVLENAPEKAVKTVRKHDDDLSPGM